jgi:uncharacterized repeat protein (TIGR01451 family)
MKKNLLLSLIAVLLFTGDILAQCVASFTYSGGPQVPAVITFMNTSTGSQPLTYQWSFGDGSNSTVPNPTHTYTTGGMYYVTLFISDGLGCSDSSTVVVSLNVTPGVAIQYFDDSLYYFCTTPASEDFYYYGGSFGYAPTDSVKFNVIFGDGTDSTFYLSAANTSFGGMFTHIYTNAGNYNPQLIVTGPDLAADTMNANPIIVGATCGSITGTIYQDINNNCIYDAGDILLPYVSLTIYDGSTLVGWASSDSNGVYSFNVPTGPTYTIQVNTLGGYYYHLTPSCPLSGSITVSSLPSTGNDFGLVCPPGFDLQGFVSGWGFRPGFTTSVCIYAYNQFCNTPNGQIEIILDSDLTPLPDTTGVGYTITGQTVTLPISSPDLNWSFCIPVTVATNAQIGDSVCITMNLTPVVGDSTPANNTQTFCFPVRNSWDPNDKYVIPSGDGAQGAIRPNTDLTYTIRFQNTGNAEAINIYILDTLDANLDPTSLEVIATSHTMHWSTLAGNIIRFNYDNIMLPDSNANEPASHGYVSYRIKQNNNVAHLTQIQNSASIYFDFNPPIYTNKTVNTVDMFLSISKTENNSSLINIYPNPSSEKCQLFFKDQLSRKIIVTDALGKEVLKSSFHSDSYILNTSKLPEGIYTIKIIAENRTEGLSKIVVIH